MLTILNSILVDIVEMIIVSSKNYELFDTMKKVIVKLQESSIVSRINNKLSECYPEDKFAYHIKLNDGKINYHREYDKPARYDDDDGFVWYYDGLVHRRDDLPSECHFDGSREWKKHGNKQRYYDNPGIICHFENYEMVAMFWYYNNKFKRNNKNPACVSNTGTRCIGKRVWEVYAYL